MSYDKRVEKKVVSDFAKALSCSYSVTLNLGQVLGAGDDDLLLRSVVGFGSGVATMGDTCGAVNGAITVLGRKFPELPSPQFYLLCSEFFRRLEQRVGTNCGKVHGGKHLASDFRRAILTGKSRKCMKILKEGSEILAKLAQQVEEKDFSFIEEHDYAAIERITQYFEQKSFHCCQSTVSEIGRQSSMQTEHISSPARGFCGGIGFNGTLCGAIVGGVLCLGSRAGVDLSKSGYKDTLRIVFQGLLKSDGIFRDEKRFLPAKLYGQCQKVYRTVEEKYGGTDCHDILALRLDTGNGVQQYIADSKIDLCQTIVQTVADAVISEE